VCYSVPDLKEAREALRIKGYRMVGTASTAIGAAGQPISFLDPAGTGVLIELRQDSPGS
jgi:hypothetical protein